jgi:hypothetical protein
MKSFISIPTRRSDTFSGDFTKDHSIGSFGLRLTSEGLLFGASLRLHAKSTSSSPASCDIKFTMPSHAEKCFAGGRKVSRVLMRRSKRARWAKDLIIVPPKAASRRCHDDYKSKVVEPASTHVSISLGRCKVMSQCNGLSYPMTMYSIDKIGS